MSNDPVQQSTISDAEVERIKRARAVARRAALREAVEVLDALKKQIEANCPGRGRGSVSQVGQFAADAVQRGADAIWAMREKVEVP